jgi:ABC-type lipoprotein release transport system permease subunit
MAGAAPTPGRDETRSRAGNDGVRMWTRNEIAARWRSLIVLGLLAGLAGGVCLAAVAGARRTDSAYSRYRAATAAPDAIVFGTQVGIHDADYTPVMKLPEVIDGGTFNLAPIGIKEVPEADGSLAPGDTHLYNTLARPLVREGRLPNPHRVDEMLLNQAAADLLHKNVGDKFTLISSSNLDAFYGQAPLKGGPTVRATIVGIGDSLIDLIFQPDEPAFIPSGAFLVRYGDVVAHAPNLVVRLKPGTDVAKFHERAAKAMGLPDIPVRDVGEDAKRFTHATDVERTGLLLFAAAAALAGLVLVGQALSRSIYAMAETAPTLRALGFTRRDLITGLVQPLAISVVVGAVSAFALAVALSPIFPIGLARRLEPDRGVHVDALILGLGAAIVIIGILALGIGAALRATSRRLQTGDRGSALVRAIRTVSPLPLSLGAGMALERGRGPRALPVRPALTAAIVGVLGIVASFGLVNAIDDALTTPKQSGQVFDAFVSLDETHDVADLEPALRADPAIKDIVFSRRAPVDVNGAGIPVYSLKQLRGSVSYTVLSGRAPKTAHEIALGPASAKGLHVGIGDTIKVTGTGGSVRARIVGTALLPQTPHSSFDQGGWMTPKGLAAAKGDARTAEDEAAPELAVTFRRGANRDAAMGGLFKLGVEVEDGRALPQDVVLLRNVRSLPKWLAAFLAFLGIAAVGHVLVTAVRRRRHDLAVLRAVGFRPRQAAGVISWQAMTVGAVGLLLGIPLGIYAGQVSWRWVADSTPLLYVAPIAAIAIAIAVPATLLLANMLAVFPARRAARIHPAEVLRIE